MKLGLPTRVAPWPSIVRVSLIVVSQSLVAAMASSTLIARPGVRLIVSGPTVLLAWSNAQAKLFGTPLLPQVLALTVNVAARPAWPNSNRESAATAVREAKPVRAAVPVRAARPER